MSQTVLERIQNLLVESRIEFREVDHAPTFTSQESAAARGEPLEVGAKALLVKVDDKYSLFVLPADRKFNSAAMKQQLGVKKSRFATPEELRELTGLVPGSVPPFGHPILPLELYADESIGAQHDRVAFNAGSLTHSIIMKASDWLRVAKPIRFAFSQD